MPTRKARTPPQLPRRSPAAGPAAKVEGAVLPESLVERLLEAASVPVPGAQSRAAQSRARSRLMQRVAREAAHSVRTVRHDDSAWQRYLRGVDRLVVEESGANCIWLLRLAAGASLPPHDHDHGDEESFVLSGSCIVNGELLRAGDYHLACAGSHHDRLVSEEGCMLWLRLPAPQARLMSQVPASAPRA